MADEWEKWWKLRQHLIAKQIKETGSYDLQKVDEEMKSSATIGVDDE